VVGGVGSRKGRVMSKRAQGRRIIQVGKTIIGPPEPRCSTVRARRLADYPQVTAAHLAVAKRLSSPMLLGPPICDELVALVEHTFTEEEADVVRRLKTLSGRTAKRVARAARRPVEEIEPILDRLAFGKRTIAGDGPADARRYRLMPIIPGIYEMVLIGESPEKLSEWHRRFAELVEALYDTGYLLQYQDRQVPMVRFLPVGRAVGSHPAALPSDKLQPVLDRFDTFAVGNCQCRISGHVKGQPCGKPLSVCTAMGKWAEMAVEGGYMRRISKPNLLEIKREAESHGLVTWIMNVRSTGSQASCSCCGCCCKAMRVVNEFSAPGMMAPPHFMPQFDRDYCTCCGQCATSCPMGAITVDTEEKTLSHQPARCIGCGQCMLACDRYQAIRMEPVPEYRLPYRSWLSLILRNAPSTAKTLWKAWRSR